MAENRIAGKFAFLLHADVAGSTLLVQRDEHLAHERIQDTFRRFGSTIARYHGRVRELRGDALLAEFERASDAVTAAVAFQTDEVQHYAQLQDDIRPTIRVGIAMGEVVFADRTVTGAGVVLAQRMEQMAEPGTICITGAVHESLPQRLPFDQENLGEREVKGFDEPVRAYSVRLREGEEPPEPAELPRGRRVVLVRKLMMAALVVVVCGGGVLAWYQPWVPGIERASPDHMALPLPDKPSIVVLPFNNLSGDPAQEYLADGMTETIISVLSQVPDLFVISRNSAFTYKSKPVRVRQVAEELGIRYVLEGSVQRSGDRVRITADLIDAVKGNHIWSERYDRTFADLFALQDDIALKTVVSLQVKLTMGEQARVLSRTTDNVEAWTYYTQALAELLKFSKESNARARQLSTKALSLDPEFADAMVVLGFTHLIDARNRFSRAREESLRLAIEHAERAGKLAPEIPMLYNLQQAILRFEGKLDEAVKAGERAIELSPSTSISLLATAMTMHFAGEFDRSIELAKQAMRHNPHYSSSSLIWVGWSSWFKGDYDGAISAAEEGLRRAEGPTLEANHYLTLALVYSDRDEPDKARQALANVRKGYPQISVAYFRQGFPYKTAADQERFLNALRRAGVPEEISQ